MKKKITLITGGAGSGKTSYALELTDSYEEKAYVATAEITDDEMELKVEKHKAERNHTFTTYEEPVELHQITKEAALNNQVVLIDCITFWINNLMHYDKDFDTYVEKFIKSLKEINKDIIIVSNEVGVGIIPADAMTRDYARKVARVNRQIASIANHVYMMVAGIPMTVK